MCAGVPWWAASMTSPIIASSTTSSTSPGTTRWRVAAKPAELLTLAARVGHVAESVRFAATRCGTNPHVDASGMEAIVSVLMTLSTAVRRVGADLDAADLATQLRRVSNAFAASMRSRALLTPSGQARMLGRGDRQFLRILAAGHGQVVEVLGDLQHARHVAVIVPGMTNSLADYDPNTRDKGRHLAAAMRALDPNTAVVTWLGYRTPDFTRQHLLEGMSVTFAQKGAKQLLSDLELIRRMAPHAHVSLIGHSYGTVVLGQAMMMRSTAARLDATGVTDIVAVASPGMRTRSRKALGHPRIDLWATKAPADHSLRISTNLFTAPPVFSSAWWKRTLTGFVVPPVVIGPVGVAPLTISLPHPVDPIPYVPLHGEDPSAKGFGAKRFSSGGAKNHSTYFEPNTVSLENLARIATDRPVLVG